MGYIGAGLLALGALPLVPMIGGAPGYLEKGIVDAGFNEDNELDIGWQQYVPGFDVDRVTRKAEKRRSREAWQDPRVAKILEVAGTPDSGIPEYDMSQDPYEFANKYRTKAQPVILKNQLALRGAISDADFYSKSATDARAVRDKGLLQQSQMLAANLEQIRQQGVRADNAAEYNMRRLEIGDKRAYEERTDKLRLQNQIAMNNNNFQMAQLGLQKQEMANRDARYSQQLSDAKETRNLALIGATLDGLGMTVGGLLNRRA
tara:strand:- start:838 stop:1620 length:783 start_codon:yes stop_codon:yes gene_type:complete